LVQGGIVMITLVVNIAALALIGAIVWWFWIKQPNTVQQAEGPIEIVVDNGVYTPSRIQVPSQKPVTLRFVRKDPSPCAQKVIFDDLNTAADLPVDEPVDVTLTPPKSGDYEFTCEMQMYRGTLVAR
jgi:plastocyanin domain-containing protein